MASQVAGAGQGIEGQLAPGRAVLVGQVVTSKPEQLAYSPTNLESLRLGMKRPLEAAQGGKSSIFVKKNTIFTFHCQSKGLEDRHNGTIQVKKDWPENSS